MSETLPTQQNEPQAWKRELPLHHERAGTLKPEETLALIGSFTESSLEACKEKNQTGEMSDYDFGLEQRTHAAALEQLSTLKIDGDIDALNAIVGRQKELEVALDDIGGDVRRTTEERKLRGQLAGTKLLNSIYLNVVDNLDSLAEANGDGNKRNFRNRVAAINQMIEQHNEQVSRGSENIADSPEAREAQERMKAHYAEQANQPQPTESVDNARQKVAEAFSGTGEKERQALIGEVLRAAKGSARIHTSVTQRAKLQFKDREDTAYNDGFSDFGDGLNWGEFHWREGGTFLEVKDSPEALIFESDTATRYKSVTKTVETGGRFRKKTEQIEEQVPDGEVPVMILNPATGQQEPGVKVRYQFDSNGHDYNYDHALESKGRPQYNAPDNNRGGNQLFIEVTLPKTVADNLKQIALHDPSTARQFAQSLLAENGATQATVKMPPYAEMPADWTMAITDMHKDSQFGDVRHTVVSQQAVRVVR